MNNSGLDELLGLNGVIIAQEGGYWVKFEAHKVKPSNHIPHGISYSLTLHDNYNQRILGFDNAHEPKGKKRKKFQARRTEYDHKHQDVKCKGVVYEFESPEQLLIDFWKAVDEILKNEGVI